jgi:predicted transcriptional regulator
VTPGTAPPDIIAAFEKLRGLLDPAHIENDAKQCGISTSDARLIAWQILAPELATLNFPGLNTDDATINAAGLRQLGLTARLRALGGDPATIEKYVEGVIFRELSKIPTDIPPSTWGPLALMPRPTAETFLIPGIWVNYGVSAWVADGGVGKGTLGTRIAYDLATGSATFAGLPIFDPHPRNVLIVDFEHHYNEWYNRLAACPTMPENVIYFNTTGKMDTEGPRIATAVAEYGIEVVIVDSAGFAIPTDTKANDLAAPIAVCEPLSALGIPVLLFAHPTHEGQANPEDILGSAFWKYSTRLQRGAIKESDRPHVVKFGFSKLNTGPKLPPITFQIDGHDDGLTVTHVENATGTESGTSVLILRALTAKGPMTQAELASRIDRKADTIKKAITDLESATTDHGPRVEKFDKRGQANVYRLTGTPTLALISNREVDNVGNRMGHDIGEDAWRATG